MTIPSMFSAEIKSLEDRKYKESDMTPVVEDIIWALSMMNLQLDQKLTELENRISDLESSMRAAFDLITNIDLRL